MTKLLSTKEVANILGLHEQVIRRYIDEGDLNRWLEERKTGAKRE